MKKLLSAAGRAALRAFVAALVAFGFGLLSTPGLNKLALVGTAALVSALVAALRTVQAYRPTFSLAHLLGSPYGDWADSFVQAFVGSLVVTLTGWLGSPDLHTGRALAVGAIVGALNAGLRAVQGALTRGEYPAPQTGLADPPAS